MCLAPRCYLAVMGQLWYTIAGRVAGKSAELTNDWSPVSNGLVLEHVEDLAKRVAADGTVLLHAHNSAKHVWKRFADQHKAFAEHLEWTEHEQTVIAPDGKTKHLAHKALEMLLDPDDYLTTSRTN